MESIKCIIKVDAGIMSYYGTYINMMTSLQHGNVVHSTPLHSERLEKLVCLLFMMASK